MIHKVLTHNPAPSDGAAEVPESISVAELTEALRPLLGLLGLAPEALLVDGFEVTGHEIMLKSAIPLVGVDPEPSDDSEGAIWIWPARVAIRRVS